MQGQPDAKKPCKGILKTSSSFDRHSTSVPAPSAAAAASSSHRKSAKFDELNVLQTYHPPDKDYGHMKIEEPKTPYVYDDSELNNHDELDAELLAEKLRVAANARTSSYDDSSDDEDVEETDEQKGRRIEFEKRRKAHYREFEAVRLARKLIEEEDDEDDDHEPKKDTLTENLSNINNTENPMELSDDVTSNSPVPQTSSSCAQH